MRLDGHRRSVSDVRGEGARPAIYEALEARGVRLVKHARYYWLLLAESHLTRHLFGAMLQRIWVLPVPAG